MTAMIIAYLFTCLLFACIHHAVDGIVSVSIFILFFER